MGLVFTSSLVAEEGDWGGVIGLEGGTFDTSSTYFFGVSGGISYESAIGRHYLMLGGGLVTQEGSDSPFVGLGSPVAITDDASLFSIGYRHGFVVSEKFEPFVEVGYGMVDWSVSASDALGNPANVDEEAGFFSVGVGLSYSFWENWSVTARVDYVGFENAPFGEVTSDVFGNPAVVSSDASLLARFGIGVRF